MTRYKVTLTNDCPAMSHRCCMHTCACLLPPWSVVFAPPDAPEAGQRSRTRPPDSSVRYERGRSNHTHTRTKLRCVTLDQEPPISFRLWWPPDRRTAGHHCRTTEPDADRFVFAHNTRKATAGVAVSLRDPVLAISHFPAGSVLPRMQQLQSPVAKKTLFPHSSDDFFISRGLVCQYLNSLNGRRTLR